MADETCERCLPHATVAHNLAKQIGKKTNHTFNNLLETRVDTKFHYTIFRNNFFSFRISRNVNIISQNLANDLCEIEPIILKNFAKQKEIYWKN
jgi:hypothetical protein